MNIFSKQFLMNAKTSILPSEYRQAEYLEGTGTQWIDTDIHTDQDTGFYLDASLSEVIYPTATQSANMLCGQFNANYNVGYVNSDTNKYIIFGHPKGENNKFYVTADTERHTYQDNYLNNRKYIYDDMELDISPVTFTNGFGFCIFRTTNRQDGRYWTPPIKAKIYRLKMSQGDTITHDFYPAVRKSDGEAGLYDITTDIFYTNSGSGEFITG